MLDNETLTNLFGSRNFKNFGKIGDGLRVVYPITTDKFPTGYVNDPNGKAANDCRKVVDDKLGNTYGPALHLALAPHKEHNLVGVYKDGLQETTAFVGDGIIIKRTGTRLVVDTFLADCSWIVVWTDEWVGCMHCGWPELVQMPEGVIDKFFSLWPGTREETSIWMGPCITQAHFERKEIPAEPDFLQPYVGQTNWGTQGFALDLCIKSRLRHYLDVTQFTCVGVDPYSIRESGDYSWAASDQWAKRKSNELGFPVCNLRNTAMLFIEG